MADSIQISFDTALHETDTAILFDFGDEEKWIPKSLISEQTEDELTIPLWFAEKEELKVYEV